MYQIHYLSWQSIEKHFSIDCKFHKLSPIWHNAFLSGSVPLKFPQWSNQGIYVLGDISNSQGLRSFQDLKDSCSLPGSSWSFYLKLCIALKVYGVIINKTKLVATMYKKLSFHSFTPLPVTQSWENDFKFYKMEWR